MYLNKTTWNAYFTVNGVLATGEFLVGTSLNLICLSYFLRRGLAVINPVFVFVSATDLALSSIMVFSAISAFTGGQPLMFEDKIFCNIWGLVWHTGCGFSIFLMATLAFTRWLSMEYPLKMIKKRYVTCCILGYLIFQIFKSTMNYWYVNLSYHYSPAFLGCSVSNINTVHITPLDKVLYMFLYLFEVLLPGIPAIIFSMATIRCLLKKDKSLERSSCSSRTTTSPLKKRSTIITRCSSEVEETFQRAAGWKTKREATITILILIGTYLVLNIWFWALTLGDAFYIFSDKTLNYTTIWKGNMNSYFMTYYFIYIHTVVLNSSANAVIYVLRLEGMKLYILNIFRSVRKFEVYSNNAVLMRHQSTFRLVKIPSFGSKIPPPNEPAKAD